MRLLLDTHAFLWFVLNDAKLSQAAETLIADPGNDVYLSPASHWELAIKIRLGKYPLNVPFETFVGQGIQTRNSKATSRSSARGHSFARKKNRLRAKAITGTQTPRLIS